MHRMQGMPYESTMPIKEHAHAGGELHTVCVYYTYRSSADTLISQNRATATQVVDATSGATSPRTHRKIKGWTLCLANLAER